MTQQQELTSKFPPWLPISVKSDNVFLCFGWMQSKEGGEEWFPRYLHHSQWRCFVFFRIGCGLDRLKWENVSAMIEEVFDATDIRITVYTLWTDERFGCVPVFLYHPCWAVWLGKLTLNVVRGKFHVKLSVSQATVRFLYSHDWTGTMEETFLGKCCCDFSFFFFLGR